MGPTTEYVTSYLTVYLGTMCACFIYIDSATSKDRYTKNGPETQENETLSTSEIKVPSSPPETGMTLISSVILT